MKITSSIITFLVLTLTSSAYPMLNKHLFRLAHPGKLATQKSTKSSLHGLAVQSKIQKNHLCTENSKEPKGQRKEEINKITKQLIDQHLNDCNTIKELQEKCDLLENKLSVEVSTSNELTKALMLASLFLGISIGLY